MFKKIFLIALLLILQPVFAAETAIEVTPKQKYSTCAKFPQVGDFLDFVTVQDVKGYKKGTLVQGLVTERQENGFSGRVGTLYVEQFKINGKNLNGNIYQKGNNHPVYFEYYDWLIGIFAKILIDKEASYVRGGEAFLRPNKDIFTLYLKD